MRDIAAYRVGPPFVRLTLAFEADHGEVRPLAQELVPVYAIAGVRGPHQGQAATRVTLCLPGRDLSHVYVTEEPVAIHRLIAEAVTRGG